MGLEITEALLIKLFNYLNKQLEKKVCKHNFAMTNRFLKMNNIPRKPVIDWLKENGAWCDCEVILNVEEKLK